MTFLSNFSLFAHCIAKVALNTGIGPAVVIAVFVRCAFPFCVLRDFHDDDHDVRIPIERYDSAAAQQLRLLESSGERQLAEIIPASLQSATSRSRKALVISTPLTISEVVERKVRRSA
jgi:hypothetical protein